METSVTVYDVAARAGVSASTVSRAFSRPDLVSAKTRKLVMETAEAMNFTVSRSSLALKSGQSFRVALLLSATVTTWFNSRVFEGLDNVLHPAGYDISIYPIGDTQSRREFFDTMPARRNADAVVVPSFDVDPEESERLMTMNVPIAGINTTSHAGMSVSVSVNDALGVRMLMRHLISLGHRRIAYVGRNPQVTLPFSTSGRLAEYRNICEQEGLEQIVIPITDDDTNFNKAFNHLVGLPQLPTAVCCQEDGIAIPLMCKMRDFGIRIPEDVSVTGFDDSTYAQDMDLTTVRQDPRAMASSVATKLLDIINDRKVAQPFEEFPLEMVVRGSTTAPRATRALGPAHK
ncbi:LacI family DNA-binding transcriptional regulator [Bifidobacterium goeldii]|nr:LacI family DNA-binding transcriptional regulator [Bifidobacterium goeldii]